MKRAILFLGPQGSGKGTQSQILAKKLGWSRIEAGQLVRDFATTDSPQAIEAREQLIAGKLVGTPLILRLFDQTVEAHQDQSGIIFDGFFRRPDELKHEKEKLNSCGFELTGLLIEIDDAEATKRLLARGRADDQSVAIAQRLHLYHQEIEPVVRQLELAGKLKRVNGLGTVEEVAARVWKAVDEA